MRWPAAKSDLATPPPTCPVIPVIAKRADAPEEFFTHRA
jgi:hypothetical protein